MCSVPTPTTDQPLPSPNPTVTNTRSLFSRLFTPKSRGTLLPLFSTNNSKPVVTEFSYRDSLSTSITQSRPRIDSIITNNTPMSSSNVWAAEPSPRAQAEQSKDENKVRVRHEMSQDSERRSRALRMPSASERSSITISQNAFGPMFL